MDFDFSAPVYIVPAFREGHADFAKTLGFVIGPLAHEAYCSGPTDFIFVKAPDGWSHCYDYTRGQAFYDQEGLCRVFGDASSRTQPKTEALTRFVIDRLQGTIFVQGGGSQSLVRSSPHLRPREKIADSVSWLAKNYPEWENPLAYWDIPTKEIFEREGLGHLF